MDPITLTEFLPPIDINAGLTGAADILRSPALAPLVLLGAGVGIFLLLFYAVVEAVAYILERFGFIRPVAMLDDEEELEDGVF